MNKIFKLSTEISEMPVLKQKKNLGGYGMSTISLSGVTVSAPGGGGGGWPSFDFPSSDGGGPSSAGGGGGSTGGGNNQDTGGNIRDPDGILAEADTKINQRIELLKQFIQSGSVPDGREDNAQELLDAYQETLDTINLLENSDNKYRIDVKELNGEASSFSYDQNSGEFVITVEALDDDYDLSLLAHELEHANQLENGELYLKNSDIEGYDINDEVDAYELQHKFNSGIYFDTFDLGGNQVNGPYEVTPDEIYNHFPGLYDNLQGESNGGENQSDDSASSGSHR